MTLTDYIIALIKHPDIKRADPVKAAERFGVRLDWARYYLGVEISRRGL